MIRIYLPVYEREPPAGELRPSASPLAPYRELETILLVEAERRIRRSAQRALENLGHRVLTVETGRDALALYQSVGTVDLVLTVVVVPEMGAGSCCTS